MFFIFYFLNFKLLFESYLNTHKFPEKCPQRILLGFSSFMWLLKYEMLWHGRFLSVVSNALFQLQKLKQRQLHSLPLKLQKVSLFL